MATKPSTPRPAARTTISVQGARVHNLRNISVDLPRDRMIVITGLAGSGKSSLAFDTIYAEGQRRYLESLSSYAKRFVAQVSKPDVDFVFGLSPVISIEQKTTGSNPRSTVGTMTDVASYLNLLFATIGEPHCPRTGEPVPSRSSSQIVEAILSLPEGSEIELRAPIFKVYGEDLEFVFTEVRKKGCRTVIVDGKPLDISEEIDLDADSVQTMDAVVDHFAVSRKHEKAIKAGVAATLMVGDGLLQVRVTKGAGKAEAERFYKGLSSGTHHLVYGDFGPAFFVFNDPESACRTCGGLGVDKVTHPELLIPDPKRSILGGCFVKEAFKYNPDTWDGRMMYSLSVTLDFALDSPWTMLPEKIRKAILFGIDKKIALRTPPDARVPLKSNEAGRELAWHGVARRIERHYRRYRQRGEANSKMEAWLDKVMVEHTCPDCNGARLGATRALFTIGGKAIYDGGHVNFHGRQVDLRRRAADLRGAARVPRHHQAGRARRRCRPPCPERNPRTPGVAAGHRARLPELQSPRRNIIGRRVAANPLVHADRIGTDGDALRARRAEHRAASQRQRQDDRHDRAAPRHWQHRHRGRTRRGYDSRGRLPRRDGPGRRRARRMRRGPRRHRRPCEVQGLTDRPVPVGQARHRDAREAAKGKRADPHRPRCQREQPEIDRRHVPARHVDRDYRRL